MAKGAASESWKELKRLKNEPIVLIVIIAIIAMVKGLRCLYTDSGRWGDPLSDGTTRIKFSLFLLFGLDKLAFTSF